MFPTIEQAEAWLQDGVKRNPGLWDAHSRYVGQAARAIAERIPELDPEKAQELLKKKKSLETKIEKYESLETGFSDIEELQIYN